YSKAAKAELSRDYDVAFRLYVKSAELYLHLSRTWNDNFSVQAGKWKASAAKALERAEKIKAFVDKRKTSSQHDATSTVNTSGVSTILTPVGIDHFSPQEQSFVLKKGASINGLYFPLWDQSVSQMIQIPYEDPDGPPKLSPEQAKVSPVWRHVPPIRTIHARHEILPQEILQHVVTDCSVCASISVCLEHARRFNSNVRLRTDSDEMLQSDGRYDIKILFNGGWRRIVVDDQLPYHPVNGMLMCMSVLPPRSDPTAAPALWPSILEKLLFELDLLYIKYMKLMGGYDFPGSNSSIDLHAIAGWIPEHIEIKGSSFEREKTWERVAEGFARGHCVLTLGTGVNPYITWEDVDLLSSHSYAVIDVKESDDGRILTILDTWVNPNHEKQFQEPRALQVPWLDVLNVFDGIYLSWDTSLWENQLTFHGMWKRKGQDETTIRHTSLRFAKRSPRVEEEILVLLTRHVTDSSRTMDYISLKVQLEDDMEGRSNFLDQTTIAARGTYTNSTHVLVRTKVLSSMPSGVLSIFASYDGDGTEVGYTLSAYATSDFDISWDETPSSPPFTKKIEGILTSKNAGGNCTYPTFMANPQYHLQMHPERGSASTVGRSKAKVALILQTSRDTPVNISLVYSQGGRIDELVENELLASSGAYSYGMAQVRKDISPGDSTVILSAFEPHHMGPYTLRVESSLPFDLRPIPQEGAGMYAKVVRGTWTRDNAGGGPTSERYSKNPIFEIDIPVLTQFKIRLQLIRPFTPTSLNITIFPASPDDALKLSLAAGKYLAVPSTYNPGVEAGFQLLVYTSVAGIQVREKTLR
ncbi:Calpain-like protease palB/RIM13, partial [Termitomyces sp. J132]